MLHPSFIDITERSQRSKTAGNSHNDFGNKHRKGKEPLNASKYWVIREFLVMGRVLAFSEASHSNCFTADNCRLITVMPVLVYRTVETKLI